VTFHRPVYRPIYRLVGPLHKTVDALWLFTTPFVNRNPLNQLLRSVVNLLHSDFLELCRSWLDIDWHTAARSSIINLVIVESMKIHLFLSKRKTETHLCSWIRLQWIQSYRYTRSCPASSYSWRTHCTHCSSRCSQHTRRCLKITNSLEVRDYLGPVHTYAPRCCAAQVKNTSRFLPAPRSNAQRMCERLIRVRPHKRQNQMRYRRMP